MFIVTAGISSKSVLPETSRHSFFFALSWQLRLVGKNKTASEKLHMSQEGIETPTDSDFVLWLDRVVRKGHKAAVWRGFPCASRGLTTASVCLPSQH